MYDIRVEVEVKIEVEVEMKVKMKIKMIIRYLTYPRQEVNLNSRSFPTLSFFAKLDMQNARYEVRRAQKGGLE